MAALVGIALCTGIAACATGVAPGTPGLSADSAARVCVSLLACGVPLPFAACAASAQNLASNVPDAVS